MANIRFKAGILARNGEYYGAQTKLPSKSFDLGRCTTLELGWITPPANSGIGTPSNALGFTQDGGNSAQVCAYILYDEKFNQRDRYLITCNSGQFQSMQGVTTTNSTVPLYVELSAANGSGYSIAP